MAAREVDGIVVSVSKIETNDSRHDLCTVELPAAYDYDRVLVRTPFELKIMRDIAVRILYDPDADPPTAEYMTIAPREAATQIAQQRSINVLSAYGLAPLLDDIGASLGRVDREPEVQEFLTSEQYSARHAMPSMSIAPELERIIRDEIANRIDALANRRIEHVVTNETVVTYGVRKSTQNGAVGFDVSVTGTDLADMQTKFDAAAVKVKNDTQAIINGNQPAQTRMKI
jgi:hypothetical protein